MVVEEQILDWASKQPVWLQDLLRRVASGSLSERDLDEVLAMLRAQHGGPAAPAGVPVAREHLPLPGAAADSLALVEIKDVQRANRLRSGAALRFSASGLTVVYGDNGSGKSGFARLLRRACGVRGSEKILPNVFAAKFAAQAPAAACFVVVERHGAEGREIIWADDGRATDPILGRIRFFDSRLCELLVTTDEELTYVPASLRILTHLAAALDQVDRAVGEERDETASDIGRLVERFPPGAARTFASELSADVEEPKVREASRWDPDADEGVLTELSALVAGHGKEAKSLQSCITRLEGLRERAAGLAPQLSAETIAGYRALHAAVAESRDAAATLAGELATVAPLPGVGGATWRRLWGAAREYHVKDACPGVPFPPNGEGARCPLCQDQLSTEGRARLARFDEYMRATAEGAAKKAADALAAAADRLVTRSPVLSLEEGLLLEELGPLGEADAAAAITAFFAGLGPAREAADAALRGAGSDSFPEVPPPVDVIDAALGRLRARASRAALAATPEGRAKLDADRAALELRKVLTERLEDLLSIRDARARLRMLERCRAAAGTAPVTYLMKKLEEECIRAPFRDALVEELTELDVPVKVEAGFSTRKAATQHRPKLGDAASSDIAKVLSEGEHRAVALACFFAEVRQSPTRDALFLDDPVSSLDHERRARVAKRLVTLAKVRQVIVLTHDLSFLAELRQACGEEQVTVASCSVERGSEGHGVSADGLPWIARTVAERLQQIEAIDLPRLSALRENDDPSYGKEAEQVGKRLRDTWERLVEEGAFNKVVERFRPSVKTQSLAEVVVTDDLHFAVFWGVSRCSAWAHDRPAHVGHAVPSIQELRDEIQKIRDCLKTEKEAGRKARERRKANEAAPTVKL